jgi:hypothetical protein
MAVVEVQQQLPRDLANREVGQTRIQRVEVDLRQDSDGEPAIRITLILSDPPGKSETWPVRDLWSMREVVYDAIVQLDPPFPWFIEFEPEHPGDLTERHD